MTARSWNLAALSALLLGLVPSAFEMGTPVWADKIIKRGGDPADVIDCDIEEATWEKIVYRLPGISQKQEVKAGDVQELVWERVGSAIRRGAGHVQLGEYEEAEKSLKGTLNSPGKQRGYTNWLLAKTYLAMGSADPSKYQNAMSVAREGADKYKSKKDFYVPLCLEILGQAAIAAKDFSAAGKVFSDLASGTYGALWKTGAQLGLARVMLAEGKFKDARGKFGDLRSGNHPPEFIVQAHLGYAEAQLGQGQFAPAAATLEKLLGMREAARMDAHRTRAFIVWGDAQKQMGGNENLEYALVRYFRAIAIGSPETELLAEAIYKAKEVCKELGWNDKAAQLKEELAESYKKSAWNK